MMTSTDYRILYLALLKDYEENARLIMLIENSLEHAVKNGFECLADDFNVRLVYLKQHELDVSALIKKVYKLWKGGNDYDKKEDGSKS